jgi:hypothetical protein
MIIFDDVYMNYETSLWNIFVKYVCRMSNDIGVHHVTDQGARTFLRVEVLLGVQWLSQGST